MPKPLTSAALASLQQSFDQALGLHRQGQLAEAERIYGRILKALPNHFDSLQLLAQLKMQRDKPGEALRLMTSAVKLRPDVADAHAHLGQVLARLGRYLDALASFDTALRLDPKHGDAMGQRADILLRLGRPADALAGFDALLALAPQHLDARVSRGVALARLGRYADALAQFDAVLAVTPHPAAAFNRGNALLDLDRHAEAVAAYDQMLAAFPNHVAAWNNRGRALQTLNRHAEAIDSFERALAVDPDYADAHFNKSHSLLTLGDYGRGFVEYEWRWRRTGMTPNRVARPLWLGEFPATNRTILITAEQGLGDTIQFARYVPLLARSGGKVILEVQPELRGLLSRIEGASQVIARGESRPPFDLHCPLGSLPLAFRTEIASVPAEIPYLDAAPERIGPWRARMEKIAPPRIGIVWAGNPAHPNDANRSIPLAALSELWTSGAQFISLQRDVRDSDRHPLASSRLIDFTRDIADFDDTAAIISLCDLVVSVDTAVAHLAGAMGRPTSILLPFVPDWRWTLSDVSPWYPAAKLFRQSHPGDWTDVIERLRGEIGLLTNRVPTHQARALGI
jgi:tetratricopeptide (TPR) repeat protein